MEDLTTFSEEPLSLLQAAPESVRFDALVVLWSREEPELTGAITLIPKEPPGRLWTVGRGLTGGEGSDAHLTWYRQRPGRLEPMGPLGSPRISRAQLTIESQEGGLQIQNTGRCALRVDGAEQARVWSVPGMILELHNELLLYHCHRPGLLPAWEEEASPHAFGRGDGAGMVGESPEMWELRRKIDRIAPQPFHTLVLGPSGVGKELVARALHQRSSRSAQRMVARNAATIPEGLVDAEFFGNMRHYPNPGMPERLGLVGEAHGGTLFLDEFGELSHDLQSHLLRVMDEGEYQRLGDAQVRHSDFRLIAATNRPQEALKRDVLARLKTRIRVPDLNARREDIPLLVHHLLRRMARESLATVAGLFRGGELRGFPRLTPGLIRSLVLHPYQTHVRELETLLLKAIVECRGAYLDLTPGLKEEMNLMQAPRASLMSESQLGPAGPHEPVLEALEPLDSKGDLLARRSVPVPLKRLSQAGPVRPDGRALASLEPFDSKGDPPHAPLKKGGRPEGRLRHTQMGPLPDGLSYAALTEHCEAIKSAYVLRVYEACDRKIFRAAKRLGCNRDVIRRVLSRAED